MRVTMAQYRASRYNIVGIGDTTFLVADLYNWAAYPVSYGDLRCIATNLA